MYESPIFSESTNILLSSLVFTGISSIKSAILQYSKTERFHIVLIKKIYIVLSNQGRIWKLWNWTGLYTTIPDAALHTLDCSVTLSK